LAFGLLTACTRPASESVREGGGVSVDGGQGMGQSDMLTVFLTGNGLGELKPCGCSGGQLGGLERRGAILNTVPASSRLIVDTGAFVKSDGEQDMIKFDFIIRALEMLGYDLLSLTEEDLEIASGMGLLDIIRPAFGLISASARADADLAPVFTKTLGLGKKTVAVTVAAFDVNSGQIEQVKELFAAQDGQQHVNVLIVNSCETAAVDSIRKMGIVDCLVCPPEMDEAMLISGPGERPLVVSVGRFGRYVGRLQIKADDTGQALSLRYRPADVNEGLKPQESLVDLYKSYQLAVKDANLLEREPRYPLDDGLGYVGSESCKGCHEHEYAYEQWSTKRHAHAYATLEKAGSQYDPECIVCHVVGFKYESGFVSEGKTGHLKDVGCENCHGPGSKHIKDPWNEKYPEPRQQCLDCHTPEHSGAYAGNEETYLKKIDHWTEPNSPGDVK
jgi:hypothetical protein